MNRWKESLIAPNTPIKEAIRTIDNNSLQIALVVDHDHQLLGTVTDGDVRRGILRGVPLEDYVSCIMNPSPTIGRVGHGRDELVRLMQVKQLNHIPILDREGRVVGLEMLHDVLFSQRDNWVVLMAGGLGTRLRPLTDDCPKPLLKIGSKPLLETILMEFKDHGFHQFFISVNYKAEMLVDYFGDGSRWGVNIQYIQEPARRGTAGALTLLPEKPKKPLIVMNGDLLTKVHFGRLLDFHVDHQTKATMCVREYKFQVPYGVVGIKSHALISLSEKPVQQFFVNGGIYVLDPDALDLIPRDEFYDMTSLFEQFIAKGWDTSVFPIREYWLDIGQMRDFERANGEFKAVFKD